MKATDKEPNRVEKTKEYESASKYIRNERKSRVYEGACRFETGNHL